MSELIIASNFSFHPDTWKI